MELKYDIHIYYEVKENWMHTVPKLQYKLQTSGCDQLWLQWKGLAFMYKRKNFLCNISWIPTWVE
jgi:hypothetical protein